jgi:hypothetical protein
MVTRYLQILAIVERLLDLHVVSCAHIHMVAITTAKVSPQ